MECVMLELQMDGKNLSFELEVKDLYRLNCMRFVLQRPDRILSVCILKGLLILRTEDRDFRNGAHQAPFEKDNRQTNNLDAYDWDGNHLWNIGEIVGDIKMEIRGCTLATRQALVDSGVLGRDVSCSEDLLQCYAGGFLYTVDPFSKTVLSKKSGVR